MQDATCVDFYLRLLIAWNKKVKGVSSDISIHVTVNGSTWGSKNSGLAEKVES
jgi:hypothetical protein